MGDEHLEHVGVLGMKWGRRAGGGSGGIRSGLKKAKEVLDYRDSRRKALVTAVNATRNAKKAEKNAERESKARAKSAAKVKEAKAAVKKAKSMGISLEELNTETRRQNQRNAHVAIATVSAVAIIAYNLK
jgi:hypothetical protein